MYNHVKKTDRGIFNKVVQGTCVSVSAAPIQGRRDHTPVKVSEDNKSSEYLGSLQTIIEWMFKDILVNIESDVHIWENYNKSSKKRIDDIPLQLSESNMGSVQLICSGVETFGRLQLGYGVRDKISREAFKSFMKQYFDDRYNDVIADEIYYCYRCGLLHSYIIGCNSESGFFATRSRDRSFQDRHLAFTNAQASKSSEEKTKECQRLILNIDIFYKDFEIAVTKYYNEVKNAKDDDIILKNLKISLKEPGLV